MIILRLFSAEVKEDEGEKVFLINQLNYNRI